MASRSRLEVAVLQIEFAREYTYSLIDDFAETEWFTMPDGCATHLAWQIGHLAMAQYGLCLFRVRGRQEIDTQLMSSAFRKKYSKGTTPSPDLSKNATQQEILRVFEQVHAQSCKELDQLSDADLSDTIEMPYSVEPTQLGGIYFCSAHEMMHAGQIGLLRRLLGKPPIR